MEAESLMMRYKITSLIASHFKINGPYEQLVDVEDI